MAVKKDGKHGANLRHLQGQALLAGRGQQRRPHLPAEGVESRVGVEFLEQLERGDPGGHGERVAAERAGLVHRTERGEAVHDVGAAAERSDRQAAPNHFAQCGEVRPYALALLRAAGRDAEKLQRFGIECLRVKFPLGMDANEYARKIDIFLMAREQSVFSKLVALGVLEEGPQGKIRGKREELKDRYKKAFDINLFSSSASS